MSGNYTDGGLKRKWEIVAEQEEIEKEKRREKRMKKLLVLPFPKFAQKSPATPTIMMTSTATGDSDVDITSIVTSTTAAVVVVDADAAPEPNTQEMGCQTDDVDYEALLQKATRKTEKYMFANDLMYQQVNISSPPFPSFNPNVCIVL